MKKIFFILLIIFVFANCATEQHIEYNIPPELTDFEKKYILDDLELGKVYYRKYCGECHGIFGKTKYGAPDFAAFQFEKKFEKSMKRAYRRAPVDHVIARKMSLDELNKITGFILSLKKETLIKM